MPKFFKYERPILGDSARPWILCKDGKRLWGIDQDHLYLYVSKFPLSKNYTIIEQNKKFGLLDKDRNTIITNYSFVGPAEKALEIVQFESAKSGR